LSKIKTSVTGHVTTTRSFLQRLLNAERISEELDDAWKDVSLAYDDLIVWLYFVPSPASYIADSLTQGATVLGTEAKVVGVHARVEDVHNRVENVHERVEHIHERVEHVHGNMSNVRDLVDNVQVTELFTSLCQVRALSLHLRGVKPARKKRVCLRFSTLDLTGCYS
jgi:hypothetical protein